MNEIEVHSKPRLCPKALKALEYLLSRTMEVRLFRGENLFWCVQVGGDIWVWAWDFVLNIALLTAKREYILARRYQG